MTGNHKPVAWVTGVGGLIGSCLIRTADSSAATLSFDVIGLTRQIVDLTDSKAVQERFARDRPSLVIHCAALSRSQLCERDPALAQMVNVQATVMLANLAANIPFFFFSTDLVFDGRKGAYVETDPVNPLTVYAYTKIAAEHSVLENPRHTVIRTSLNGGRSPSGDRGFSDELRKGWQEGKTMPLFADEFRSPIAAVETARAVWDLVAKGATGLLHVAGKERLSRLQIGQLLAAHWTELNAGIVSSSLAEYKGPPRSPDTSLNCARAEKILDRSLPGLTNWLKNHPL